MDRMIGEMKKGDRERKGVSNKEGGERGRKRVRERKERSKEARVERIQVLFHYVVHSELL